MASQVGGRFTGERASRPSTNPQQQRAYAEYAGHTAVLAGPASAAGLVLRSARITERLSEPFLMDLECQSASEQTDLEALLGTPVAVIVPTPRQTLRWFHGVIAEAGVEDSSSRHATVRLVARPLLWFLDAEQDCRIFQDMTVVDIVARLCSERGIPLRIDTLEHDYPQRTYCVQYRETTFAFISRLLEEEGIYYRFTHDDFGHVIELHNSAACHEHDGDYAAVRYHPMRQDLLEEEHAWGLRSRVSFRSSSFACTDYDFENPAKMLHVTRRTEDRAPVGNFEVFDYPGEYLQQDRGESLARIRLEQIRSESSRVRFEADARGLGVGSLVTLESAGVAGQDRDLLIVETRIRLSNDWADSGAGGREALDAEATYRAEVEAIDAGEQFRPPRVRHKVLVEGPQTAVVVGPEGEEIYTDRHGRVKVQFHWDRYGKRNQNSSCWIRVSEPWAGKGWGGLQVPRIGQEVIVDFLEGDPDRPIITGRVYNGANRPPVDLPSGKMISGMRSKTYRGGGHNEITFDDTDGSQRMFINAQHDQVVNVNNNRTTTVGVDSAESIGNDMSLQVGNNQLEVVGVNKTVQVGSNTTVSSGSNVVLQAGTSITLQCGASTIHMNQAGMITISGVVCTMSGSVNCNVAAPLTNVAGAAMLTQTGALNVSTGIVNRMEGGSLAHVGSGGMVEVEAGGDAAVNGANVKLNC